MARARGEGGAPCGRGWRESRACALPHVAPHLPTPMTHPPPPTSRYGQTGPKAELPGYASVCEGFGGFRCVLLALSVRVGWGGGGGGAQGGGAGWESSAALLAFQQCPVAGTSTAMPTARPCAPTSAWATRWLASMRRLAQSWRCCTASGKRGRRGRCAAVMRAAHSRLTPRMHPSLPPPHAHTPPASSAAAASAAGGVTQVVDAAISESMFNMLEG